MVQPEEKVLRSIIALNKSNDENWTTFVVWLKDSYIREGMNTNEIDDVNLSSIAKGNVRQLRHLLNYINNSEDLLQRTLDAQRKADVQ
jgi:hypothetical protein